MGFTKKHRFFLLFSALFFGILWQGCVERNINGFEENAGLYSVYGALDVDRNTNFIRVKDTRVPAIPDSLIPFEGIVTFEDLEEGTVTELNKPEVTIGGYYVNNFILTESLEPGKRYRLKVESPDGKSVTTTTRVPEITDVSVQPDSVVNCEEMIEFTFSNVKFPEHVRMEVGFGGAFSEIGLVAQLEHREDADEMFVKMNIRNLLVEVYPPSRQTIINALDPRDLSSERFLCSSFDRFVIRYTHYGPEWDIFSPGFFPHDPLQWQDVENGLGFMGSFRTGFFTYEY